MTYALLPDVVALFAELNVAVFAELFVSEQLLGTT